MSDTAGPVADTELLDAELMRRLDRLALSARRSRAGVMEGERRSPRYGQSVEFADFRPYTAGDDIRQIDWNAYARMERFFLKLFIDEEDTTIHLLLDASRSMRWGEPAKLDFARRLAAALGYIALSSLEWLAFSPYSTGLEARGRPLRGRSAIPHLFRLLKRIEAGGGTDLDVVMRRYTAAALRPGPMLVLSDLYDPGWQSALRGALGAGYDLTMIHVLSPFELDPQLEGDLRLIDDETGEAVEISAEGDTMRLYRDELDRWRTGLDGWCSDRGIVYVPVATDFSLSELVLGLLRRRGVVG